MDLSLYVKPHSHLAVVLLLLFLLVSQLSANRRVSLESDELFNFECESC